jgi:ABC-type nitrate/sulfonate/bicarbonate transport system ATPase subunit
MPQAEAANEPGTARAPGPRDGRPAVRLDRVTIEFGISGGQLFRAVEEAGIAVGAHEFVAIIGPTGCGKSTLLNAAAGLLPPASGSVEIFGRPLSGINRQAGYLFQQDALMPWKTALDNVAIGLEVAGTARSEARERARSWLARVGLASFGERYPHMLSGGQRKRVALAQVLIRDPEIILMDEPFGPLDAQTRLIMGDLLRSCGRTTARRCCSSPTIWRRRSRSPTASSSCRPGRRRASSAISRSRCRGRAIFPRSGSNPPSRRCTATSGTC